MYIKTGLKEVHDNFSIIAEHKRVNMVHGKEIVKKKTLFSKAEYAPMDFESYCGLMQRFYPWTELKGILNATLLLDDAEVYISCELAAHMGAELREIRETSREQL